MKAYIESHDFCPDNCPHAQIEKDVAYLDNQPYICYFKCANADICKHAVECYKNDLKEMLGGVTKKED